MSLQQWDVWCHCIITSVTTSAWWLFWQYNIFCTSLIPWAKLLSAKTSPSPRPSPPFLWLIPDTKSSGLHFLVRCPESAGVFWRSLNAISLSRLGIQPGCVQLQAWSFKPLSQWLNPPPLPPPLIPGWAWTINLWNALTSCTTEKWSNSSSSFMG